MATSGSLTATLGADTCASSGSVETRATLSATEAADSVSSSSKLALSAFLIYPGAALTVDIATRTIDGAWATMDASWDASASAAAPDTLSSTGIHTAVASLNGTEGADTVSSSAKLAISSSSSVSEAADTLSTTAKLALSASFSLVEDADYLTSNSSLEASSFLIATEAPDTMAATAKVAISAFLISSGSELTIDLATRTIDGAWGTMDATWDASAGAAAPDTLDATGALAIKGALGATEAADSISSTARLEITAHLATVTGTALTIDFANGTIDGAWATMDATLRDVVSSAQPDTLLASGSLSINGIVFAEGIGDSVLSRGVLGMAPPKEEPLPAKPQSRVVTLASTGLKPSGSVTASSFAATASPTQPFMDREPQITRAFATSRARASQITQTSDRRRAVTA